MSSSSVEHHLLLKNAVRGDHVAMQQLLLLHYPFIQSTVRSLFNAQLADFLEVDDLVQEVLVKLHRSMGSFQERDAGSFEAWIRSIANNCVVDAARRFQRLKRGGPAKRVHSRQRNTDQSVDTILEWLCQDSPSPDRNLRQAEARKAIQVCLSQLPAAQRQAVSAHYFEHMDANEIAVRMRRTPGAVRELLRRARERLAELMGTASTWLSNR